MNQVKQKEVIIKTMCGVDLVFILNKIPAILGRELFTQYPITATPKIGNYKDNEQLMLKLISFVQVKNTDGGLVQLSNSLMIDGNIPDWETLMKLEKEMIFYNTSAEKLAQLANQINNSLPKKIMKVFNDFTESVSKKAKKTDKV